MTFMLLIINDLIVNLIYHINGGKMKLNFDKLTPVEQKDILDNWKLSKEECIKRLWEKQPDGYWAAWGTPNPKLKNSPKLNLFNHTSTNG